jgi:hypothetical protein
LANEIDNEKKRESFNEQVVGVEGSKKEKNLTKSFLTIEWKNYSISMNISLIKRDRRRRPKATNVLSSGAFILLPYFFHQLKWQRGK